MTSIATMPAGPELDALVDALIEWPPDPLGGQVSIVIPHPVSTNLGTAMHALELWREQHHGDATLWLSTLYRVVLYVRYGYHEGDLMPTFRCEAEAPTLALAISRAIAIAGEVQG